MNARSPVDERAPATPIEITTRAVLLGLAVAVVMVSSTAYLGMKTGITAAAAFPAAVIAIAVLQRFKTTMPEQSIVRIAGSVGEALVTGVIFTIPAFMVGNTPFWNEIHYWPTVATMFVGGVLGIVFARLFGRAVVEDQHLPFPEAIAIATVSKSGERGLARARYLLGAMGVSGLWEFFANNRGLHWVLDHAWRILPLHTRWNAKTPATGEGGPYVAIMKLESPDAIPALLGLGSIIGPQLSAVFLAGGIFGNLILAPIWALLQPSHLSMGRAQEAMKKVHDASYGSQIQPIAIGAMVLLSIHKLSSVYRKFRPAQEQPSAARRENPPYVLGNAVPAGTAKLQWRWSVAAIATLAVPLTVLCFQSTGSIVATSLLVSVAFGGGLLLAAVASYLTGLIGHSSNPFSALTLVALIVATLFISMLGITSYGLCGVFVVAGVVCCMCSVASDMTQDMRVSQLIGGTPWKMQIAKFVAVIVIAFVAPLFLEALDRAYGIGSPALPCPTANLMKTAAEAIFGGSRPWALLAVGALIGLVLILAKAPTPILVAVGMYLPFSITAAVFIGGACRWLVMRVLKNQSETRRSEAETAGVLVASGLIAGAALMAMAIALVVAYCALARPNTPTALDSIREWFNVEPLAIWGLLPFIACAAMLIWVPLRAARGESPATRQDSTQ
jgi:putative OPT family oligopeptide transporter